MVRRALRSLARQHAGAPSRRRKTCETLGAADNQTTHELSRGRPRTLTYVRPSLGEGSAMGQVLHGSARTTEAVRRTIQLRQESVRALAKRYGVSPTTIQKWRKRSTTTDARMGPKEPLSTVLTPEEEAIIVAFRRHTLLPLDDCLYALQPSIPRLTRSSLHRCLERHGISRLPEMEGDKPRPSASRTTPSATSTSTSPRSGRKRASSTCSSRSTGHRSWPSPGWRRKRPDTPPRTSCAP
jgi:transposase